MSSTSTNSDTTRPVRFDEDRLTREQAADYLGLGNPHTLAVWHSTGRYNIPVIKIGRKVFYRRSDLDAFVASRTQTQTA